MILITNNTERCNNENRSRTPDSGYYWNKQNKKIQTKCY